MILYKKKINYLIKNNISLSTAESCTGGLLCSTITSCPGVSKIYNMGIVSYSLESKNILLNIPIKYLIKYGAVSKLIAELMVLNLYKISKSKLCVSTTGIAGPSGATKNKPIGLVYIGIKYKNKIIVFKKKYKGSRIQIQKKTIKTIFEKIDKLI